MKNWKWTMGIMTVILMLCCASALAADSGICDNIVWSESDGVLTLSGTGDMKDFKRNYAPWSTYFTRLEIKEGITSIGENAFYGCTSLTSVTIPDGLTKIGDFAFFGCSSLTSVTLPDGVTSIGNHVFQDCGGLENITIPDSVKSMGVYVFHECTSLTSVTVPASVESIGEYAFCDCTMLKSAEILNGVTSIGDYAFDGCISLESVTIPGSVKSIGEWAFAECYSLESVTILDGVQSIGESAFLECGELSSVSIADSVTSIESGAFDECTSLTSVTIPKGLTSIANHLFYKCKNLTQVIIPDSVTSIFIYAFDECTSLKSITFPDGVTSVEDTASQYDTYPIFYTNAGSETAKALSRSGFSFRVPGTNYDFRYAFGEDGKITGTIISHVDEDAESIKIPDNLIGIEQEAFKNCSSLKSVTLPDGVTSVGYHAFIGCSAVIYANYGTKVSELLSRGEYNFRVPGTNYDLRYEFGEDDNITGLFVYHADADAENVTILDGVTGIASSVFEGCSALKTVTLPNSMTTIRTSAFEGCTSLTGVTIPVGVTEIGFSVFEGCTSLKSVTIPDGVTEIQLDAFRDCSSLTSVTIPDSVTKIWSGAFSGCSSLTSVTIPSSVTFMGPSVFSECSGLKSVTIPGSLTSINSGMFSGCSSLTDVTIPESVTSIENRAFYNCTSLTGVTLPDSLTSIGEDAFSGCDLTKVTIPANVTAIGSNAFFCMNLQSVLFEVTDVNKEISFGVDSLGMYALTGDLTVYCHTNTFPHRYFLEMGYSNIVLLESTDDDVVQKITLPESFRMACGESVTISCTVFPEVEATVVWSSSDTAMLTVDNNGQAVALKPGTVTVTAAVGSVSDSVEIEIYEASEDDEDKVEAFVKRCYRVILGREADQGGLENWTNQLKAKVMAASNIINEFVNSQEFTNKKLSNEAAVTVLYNAMLGRNPDPAGLADWVGKLEEGNPFSTIINGFCGSQEFLAICNEYGIEPGSVEVAPVGARAKIEAFVKRCYEIILGRGADAEGLTYWADSLEQGTRAASEIIDGFVNSQEFLGKKLGNEAAVTVLYNAMLGRDPDATGLMNWTNLLNSGSPFAVVINGFCGSEEFNDICNEYGIKPGSVTVKGISEKGSSILPENASSNTAAKAVRASEYTNEAKIREFVQHCYQSVLGRSADEEGLRIYTEDILQGVKTPKQVARGFIFSDEFRGRMPGNEDLVWILYQLYLYRDADEAGLAGWVEQLNAGETLESIVDGFANSAEFKRIMNSMK